MSLFDRTIKYIERRKENIENGLSNCIPFGLPRFENYVSGIEKETFYMVSANTKVGKSQLTDFLFVYNAYEQAKKLGINLKIFYFTLEMSKQAKALAAIRYFLYTRKHIRLEPKVQKSTQEAIPQSIIDEIKNDEEFFNDFFNTVTYIDNVKTPTGIYKYMLKYAKQHGIFEKKIVNHDGIEKIDTFYVPNDDVYVLPIIDHLALLHLEPELRSKKQAMEKLSQDYLVELRNIYKMSPVAIQQQASAVEGTESIKFNKIFPSFNSLGESTVTSRDVNIGLGLFSPERFKMEEFAGYDIKFFQNNIRFMNIMGNRDGESSAIVPLYFDGAVNFFAELPKSDSKDLKKYIDNIKKIRYGA